MATSRPPVEGRHFVGQPKIFNISLWSQQPQSWRQPCSSGIVQQLHLRWLAQRLWSHQPLSDSLPLVTLTFKNNLNSVIVNQQAKYLCLTSSISKVAVQTHIPVTNQLLYQDHWNSWQESIYTESILENKCYYTFFESSRCVYLSTCKMEFM